MTRSHSSMGGAGGCVLAGRKRWVDAQIEESGVTISTDRKTSGYGQPAFTCDVKKRKGSAHRCTPSRMDMACLGPETSPARSVS